MLLNIYALYTLSRYYLILLKSYGRKYLTHFSLAYHAMALHAIIYINNGMQNVLIIGLIQGPFVGFGRPFLGMVLLS